MYCPIRNEWKPNCKERCLHRSPDGLTCSYREDHATQDLTEKERLSHILKTRGGTKAEVLEATNNIRLILVLDSFLEYLTGKSLLDQGGVSLQNLITKESFDSWNKTSFTYNDVKLMLSNLLTSLENQTCGR